jgi:hypothetical protein
MTILFVVGGGAGNHATTVANSVGGPAANSGFLAGKLSPGRRVRVYSDPCKFCSVADPGSGAFCYPKDPGSRMIFFLDPGYPPRPKFNISSGFYL